MNNFQNFRNDFLFHLLKGDNIIYRLIIINVIIFISVGLIEVIFTLFRLNIDFYQQFIWNNLAISSDPMMVIKKPWTLITYMFMHSGLFHILINMLMLYWFGKIFRDFLGDRRLFSVYIAGGLAGALLYLIAYQTIPLLKQSMITAGMVGASASVVALIVAIAVYMPNYSVFLIFLGQVKLKYLAIFMVVLDVLSLKEGNTGGHFAHLGGAFFGFVYSKQLIRGIDIASWVTWITDFAGKIFTSDFYKPKPKFKVYRNEESTTVVNEKDHSMQQEIDKILDKIAQSGYESLTEREKNILFNASKKSN